MLDPSDIRIELVVHLDGLTGTGQVSPIIRHGLEGDLMLLEVHTGISLERITAYAVGLLEDLIRHELAHLSPF